MADIPNAAPKLVDGSHGFGAEVGCDLGKRHRDGGNVQAAGRQVCI
jgi:hypothetical protein